MQAIANGDAGQASQIKFVTTSEVQHPYLLHTPARWQEVRDKVLKYPWAKESADAYIQNAARWQVPETADPAKAPDDTYGPFVFATQTENELRAAGYAWQLTGDKKNAEKVAVIHAPAERPGPRLSGHVARLQPVARAGGTLFPARGPGL